MKLVETTKPTAARAIELLTAANVLVETTGKRSATAPSFTGATSIDCAPVTELEGAQAFAR